MRTETPRFIASDNIVWQRADGTETTISLKIGTPYQVDATSWACPASLDGLDTHHMDIVGGSSLQALCLATAFIEHRLAHMLGKNETLLYAADRSPFDARLLAAIFGRTNPA